MSPSCECNASKERCTDVTALLVFAAFNLVWLHLAVQGLALPEALDQFETNAAEGRGEPILRSDVVRRRKDHRLLEILEDRLTLWDDAEAGCVFVSGMAAIASGQNVGQADLHRTPSRTQRRSLGLAGVRETTFSRPTRSRSRMR